MAKSARPSPHDLRLVDYRPRSELRVHRVGAPSRPAFAAIDAHNHLGPTPFSGDWAGADAAALGAAMEASGIAAIVDLDGGQGEALRREVTRWSALGSRVAVFGGLDYDMWAEGPDFGEEEARWLRAAAGAGARGLKVWKLLGLRARDPAGRLVAVDDPRLNPLWAAAGEIDLPVTIHVADPIAFFRPSDGTNERWEELHEHPEWHFWPTRPRGQPGADGFPPFDELIDGLETVVARHPGTTFIGAHVGCAPEDLGRVGAMLAAYPNWYVDLAARIAELGRQPYTARDLIVRWTDRVLFGTDAAPNPAAWSVAFRFLETRDESFPYDPEGGPGSQGRWEVHGLGLPQEVLRLVYGGNARRLIFRDLPGNVGGHVTLHLLAARRWEAWRADANPAARYTPAGFDQEGFVRCTDGDAEALALANRLYADDPDALTVLDLDLALAGAPWRYDDPGSADPHVYGPLRLDAVRSVRTVLRDASGRFAGFGERAAPWRSRRQARGVAQASSRRGWRTFAMSFRPRARRATRTSGRGQRTGRPGCAAAGPGSGGGSRVRDRSLWRRCRSAPKVRPDAVPRRGAARFGRPVRAVERQTMRYRVETQAAAGLVEAGTMAHAVLASAGSTGEVHAWMNVLPAGGEPESRLPEPGVDGIFCVVAGQVRAVVEARECVAGSGATFVVRADERCSLSNAADSEARALEIQVPVRSGLLAGHADTCSDEGRSGRGED